MEGLNELYELHIDLELNYNDEQLRLDSFGPWFNIEVDKHQLARAGFYYLSDQDQVKCVFCEVVIAGWTRGDNPFFEHKRHSPNCAFINEDPVNNVPIAETKHLLLEELALLRNTTSSCISTRLRSSKLEKLSAETIAETAKHPSYADRNDRLKSFVNWPQSLNQTPGELSDAGFFYLGVSDEVKCFYCGGCLRNFLRTDHALHEHKRHFFDRCKFIQYTLLHLKSSTYKLEKKRLVKSTNEQLQYLIEYMKEKEHVLTASVAQDNVAYLQMWKDLSKELNDLDGARKDVKGWREVWRNYKYNQKRKTSLVNKKDTDNSNSSTTVNCVNINDNINSNSSTTVNCVNMETDISQEFIKPNNGRNLTSPEEINLINYPNVNVQNSNINPLTTIYTYVSDFKQDDDNSFNSDSLDREIMQLRLKIEGLDLEIEKYKLELDMKVRQKEIQQKQNELLSKWQEIEKNKIL